MNSRIILITGANRGLGKETGFTLAKLGHELILTGRNSEWIKPISDELIKAGCKTHPLTLDVTNPKSINACAEWVMEKFGRLDTLINNAGIICKGDEEILKIRGDLFMKTLQTNSLGPLLMIQAFTPLLEKSKNGIVVNVSSGMGSLDEMGSGFPAYRISKTALNAVTLQFHQELSPKGIKVNSVCPGWVKTDMGGQGAPRNLQEGIKGIVWAALLPKDGPSGGFFRDGEGISF